MNAADVASLLDLSPLPVEGGWFRRTHVDGHCSAILYLLATDLPGAARSRPHRLPGTEIWHHHAGAAVDLLLLRPDGTASNPVLGSDLAAGECPQVTVPGGTWQGASTRGPWSLVGTTMAPPYRVEDFEAADIETLVAGWPAYADRIRTLEAG